MLTLRPPEEEWTEGVGKVKRKDPLPGGRRERGRIRRGWKEGVVPK